MKSITLAVAVLLCASTAYADGCIEPSITTVPCGSEAAEVLTQSIETTTPQGVPTQLTLWTFYSGVPAPTLTQDGITYNFQLEGVSNAPGSMTYFAFYGLDAIDCSAFTITPATNPAFHCSSNLAVDSLTSINGFVSGLPFECSGNCTPVIYQGETAQSLAQLSFLDSLGTDPPTSPTPEPSGIVLLGTGFFALLWRERMKVFAV